MFSSIPGANIAKDCTFRTQAKIEMREIPHQLSQNPLFSIVSYNQERRESIVSFGGMRSIKHVALLVFLLCLAQVAFHMPLEIRTRRERYEIDR